MPTREQWWAFCEKNVLKLDLMPTYEQFCREEFLWTPQPLTTKFRYVVSLDDENLFIDLIRLKDNKTKRYTFTKPNTEYHLALRPYKYFMSSLTDDQCEAHLKS